MRMAKGPFGCSDGELTIGGSNEMVAMERECQLLVKNIAFNLPYISLVTLRIGFSAGRSPYILSIIQNYKNNSLI